MFDRNNKRHEEITWLNVSALFQVEARLLWEMAPRAHAHGFQSPDVLGWLF